MKKLIVVLICISFLFIIAIGVAATEIQDNSSGDSYEIGHLMRDYDLDLSPIESSPSGIIYTKNFNILKEVYLYSGECETEKEAENTILTKYLFVEEAKSKGVLVSEQEVDRFIQEQRDNCKEMRTEDKDPTFDNYLNGLNLAEDEYYDMFRQEYENILIETKYRDLLLEDFIKGKVADKLAEEGLDVSESVFEQLVAHEIKFCDEVVLNEFNNYLNDYKEQLLLKAINPKASEGVEP